MKTLTLALSSSNDEEADNFEEFTANFDELTEDKLGILFSNGNDIILNKELSAGLSGYKNYFVINKWIIKDDAEEEESQDELTEDQGDVWKILTITEN